jgi:hypothetical protein
MPEPPIAYVQGQLHGGPHDGETIQMPWARIEVPVLRWVDDEPVMSVYQLQGPWRGQALAHYQYAEPRVEGEAA